MGNDSSSDGGASGGDARSNDSPYSAAAAGNAPTVDVTVNADGSKTFATGYDGEPGHFISHCDAGGKCTNSYDPGKK